MPTNLADKGALTIANLSTFSSSLWEGVSRRCFACRLNFFQPVHELDDPVPAFGGQR